MYKILGVSGKGVLKERGTGQNQIPESLSFSDREDPVERVVSYILITTNDCQNRCPHCFISPDLKEHGFLAVGKDGKFDRAVASSVVSGFHGGSSVALSGGEFFLHPYYRELLGEIARSGDPPRYVEIDTNMERITSVEQASGDMLAVKGELAGSGVRLCYAASVDDNHAYGTLGGSEGRWGALAEKARMLHVAAELCGVKHYFRAALTEGQKRSGYVERIIGAVGVPRARAGHYCGMDILDLIENPVSRQVELDGSLREGTTEGQAREIGMKRIWLEVAGMQDLAEGNATVCINPNGDVLLSDHILGKKIGAVTARADLSRVITGYVKKIEGRSEGRLAELRDELGALMR
jgi:hypothetical protein